MLLRTGSLGPSLHPGRARLPPSAAAGEPANAGTSQTSMEIEIVGLFVGYQEFSLKNRC
jgi:hypothetical protein